MIGALPQSLFGLRMPTGQSTATSPFTWGPSGSRRTPEDIALQRRHAQAMQAAGMDFSPVDHWTQGLARVAQGLVGTLQERRADKAAAANQAHGDEVLAALMGSGGGVDQNAMLLSAMSDPTLSDDVKSVVQMQWERANPKLQAPSEFERALEASGVMRGTPQWQEAMAAKVKNTLDPFTSVVAGGNTIMGRQSLVEQSLGGGQTTGGVPRVTDQASYDAIPAGAQFMTPDGDIRVKGGRSGAASTGGF